MSAKTKNDTPNQTSLLLTAIGSWAMMLATLISSTQISRNVRQAAVVNIARPAYSFVNTGFDSWNRNDTENETVHLPTKFDIGVRSTAITGKK